MNWTILKTKTNLNFKVWILVICSILLKEIFILQSIYSISLRIILLFSFINIIPIMFLLSFTYLFNKKYQIYYMFFLYSILSLLFFADLLYSRANNSLISFYMIFAKGIKSDISSSILSLIKIYDFIIFIDIPIFAIIVIKFKERFNKNIDIMLFSFIFILSLIILFFRFKEMEAGGSGDARYLPVQISPIGYHMVDFYKFVYNRNEKLDVEDIAEINEWFLDNEKYQKPNKKYEYLDGIFRGKNLIIVQVESLENIVIGKEYFGQEITPNINKLLKNSMFFDNINEQIRYGVSSDADLLVNTSLYPIHQGSAFVRFADNMYNSLPKLLKEQGYATISIHGDDRDYWNRERAFKSIGFDKYISEEEFDHKEKHGMGVLDKDFFNQSILEISKLKEPYYIFMMTITSHMPFNLPEELRELNIENDNEYTNGYLQSIHYTDKVFGEFYSKLKENGYLNNTVLVICGDHEGINKYYSSHLPNNNKKVPFIVHVPEMKEKVINITGGQIDIMPTLSYLFGIQSEKYSSTVMGRNLFNNDDGAVLLTSGEILGNTENYDHLAKGLYISNKIITGNYFKVIQNKNMISLDRTENNDK